MLVRRRNIPERQRLRTVFICRYRLHGSLDGLCNSAEDGLSASQTLEAGREKLDLATCEPGLSIANEDLGSARGSRAGLKHWPVGSRPLQRLFAKMNLIFTIISRLRYRVTRLLAFNARPLDAMRACAMRRRIRGAQGCQPVGFGYQLKRT